MDDNILSSLRQIASEDEIISQEIRNLNESPTDYEGWVRLGNRLAKLQSYADAVVCYNIGLKVNSNNIAALYGKGLVLNDLGKYDDAIGCYDRITRLDPAKSMNPLNAKGLALNNLGKYDNANRVYDKVIE